MDFEKPCSILALIITRKGINYLHSRGITDGLISQTQAILWLLVELFIALNNFRRYILYT